jgi:hypothetical protein
VLIENSQGFKNFLSLFKGFIIKTISNSLVFLEELLSEKPNIKNIISFFYSNLCNLACKGMDHKCVICIKGCFSKLCVKINFKYYFKSILSDFQRINFQNPNSYFDYASKAFVKFIKPFENLVLILGKHVTCWFRTLLGRLEEFRNWFEMI